MISLPSSEKQNFMRFVPATLTLSLVLIGVAIGSRLDPGNRRMIAGETSTPLQDQLPPPRGIQYVGTRSCASSNCHGSKLEYGATRGREHQIWIEQDPHAGAYQALFNERSRQIVANLKLENPAHREPVCLACHAAPAPQPSLANVAGHGYGDGVGCESCHGPAEIWLSAHTRADWNSWSSSAKSAIGFVDGNNLRGRAAACAQCHVGSPGRDVNHDLIAAGHPRLYFELSAQLARLPRHWSREKDKIENGAALEAKLWAVGQAASAAASAKLLAHRAADSHAPWPEFAEYDCYACHAALQPFKSGQADGANASIAPFKVGSLTWNTWHTALLSEAGWDEGQPNQELMAQLNQVRSEMGQPHPNREQVRHLANRLGQSLEQMASRNAAHTIGVEQLNSLAVRLTESLPIESFSGWEREAQRFLAVVAMRQALNDTIGELPLSKSDEMTLDRIRRALQFPSGFESPPPGEVVTGELIQDFLRKIRGELSN